MRERVALSGDGRVAERRPWWKRSGLSLSLVRVGVEHRAICLAMLVVRISIAASTSTAIGTKRGVVREVPMHRVGVVKPVETCALGDAERGASTPKSRGCDVGGTHSVTSS